LAQRIIGRAINEWQNNHGAVSKSKDSIRTRFDTAKHFIILIKTLFKRFNVSVHKAAKLWNDVQLKTATVTRTLLQTQLFKNVEHMLSQAGTLLQTQLFKNVEHMLSLKFYLNETCACALNF